MPSFLIFSQSFRTINCYQWKLHLTNERNIWPLMEEIFTLKKEREGTFLCFAVIQHKITYYLFITIFKCFIEA